MRTKSQRSSKAKVFRRRVRTKRHKKWGEGGGREIERSGLQSTSPSRSDQAVRHPINITKQNSQAECLLT